MTCATIHANLSKDSVVIISNVSENSIVMTCEQQANTIDLCVLVERVAQDRGEKYEWIFQMFEIKDCQRAHWKEHKQIFKERQSVISSKKILEEEARRKGETFMTRQPSSGGTESIMVFLNMRCVPLLEEIFTAHAIAIQQAFHALAIYKGASQSLLKSHFAYFDLSHNDVTTVTLKDIIAIPRTMIPVSENTAAQCERSVTHGYMCIVLSDMKHKSMALEMHQAPDANWKKLDDQWALNTLLKCNIAGKF
ncbi:uncharacterized protein ARMOST_19554 [Armillaria ostoyae]|uniref:Uncharacterized protein n=1 Tax=Armillaria ostoyae TaxID=47428 RepID=A0A284S4V9_ARMOS|nr:uncharacterized protein ARMOST_19554 [Armillaria ostoyae]